MNILVAGGAGYIGSHAIKQLLQAGHKVSVIDNLSFGHRRAVAPQADFFKHDLAETAAVVRVLDRQKIDCVLHFAAWISVGESVQRPVGYYDNNTAGTISLLKAMLAVGTSRLVFSSTAAVYGEPLQTPITETCPRLPINPYGRSKWFVEQILADLAEANSDFGAIAFRYFNVAGAATDGTLGEEHDPETHLIPLVLQAILKRRERLTVFGTDYPTPDGTCIRDYIHVEDLCDAHIRAIGAIEPGTKREYNLGIGHGYSVREVISAAERVTALTVPVEYGARRAGDPAELYADSTLAQNQLGWTPRHLDLDEIVETAYRWYRDNPDGYAD
jgi:UDP-glucose 4-epimerase